ncbi:Ubiquinone/menaquinone biosynthesis C-methyltransferase UbiE [Diplonema papillatum]|nr:Ubiquinone/menaquinone biosynthesis C-methyltransferase UbiE [Diplonema papillatum]
MSNGWSNVSNKYAINVEPVTSATGVVMADFALSTMQRAGGAAKKTWEVLDVACGRGVAAEMLLNRASAFGVPVTVDATDFAAKMVEAAAQRLGGRARRVFLADATAFPPELANTYDALVSNFGIYLVPDVPKAVLEAHRLLRPGGFLAFTLWDYDDMHKLLHQLVALVTPPCPPPVAAHIEATVRRICDVTAAEAAMHAAGFSSVCVRPLTTATVVPDLRAFFEVIMLIPLRAEAFAGVAEPGPARDTFLDKAVQLAEATLGHEEPCVTNRRSFIVSGVKKE